MPIEGLEEKLKGARDIGLLVERKRRSVRIIGNPTSIGYEELFINIRKRLVGYISLVYTQFLDTFLFDERKYSQYVHIPFIYESKKKAEEMINGKIKTEHHIDELDVEGVSCGGLDKMFLCKDSEILKIIDFFIERAKEKNEKALYEKLNDLYATGQLTQ